MNRVILVGRLTRDPDVRYSQGENAIAIARYTIAVDRATKKEDGSRDADFISCIAFGSRGEFAEKYLKKGMKIAIEGHIQTGSYTNDKNEKVYTTDVIIDSHEFCESKGNSNRTAADEAAMEGYTGEGFMSVPDGIDEELPFG